jgi:hypothetical protein
MFENGVLMKIFGPEELCQRGVEETAQRGTPQF